MLFLNIKGKIFCTVVLLTQRSLLICNANYIKETSALVDNVTFKNSNIINLNEDVSKINNTQYPGVIQQQNYHGNEKPSFSQDRISLHSSGQSAIRSQHARSHFLPPTYKSSIRKRYIIRRPSPSPAISFTKPQVHKFPQSMKYSHSWKQPIFLSELIRNGQVSNYMNVGGPAFINKQYLNPHLSPYPGMAKDYLDADEIEQPFLENAFNSASGPGDSIPFVIPDKHGSHYKLVDNIFETPTKQELRLAPLPSYLRSPFNSLAQYSNNNNIYATRPFTGTNLNVETQSSAKNVHQNIHQPSQHIEKNVKLLHDNKLEAAAAYLQTLSKYTDDKYENNGAGRGQNMTNIHAVNNALAKMLLPFLPNDIVRYLQSGSGVGGEQQPVVDIKNITHIIYVLEKRKSSDHDDKFGNYSKRHKYAEGVSNNNLNNYDSETYTVMPLKPDEYKGVKNFFASLENMKKVNIHNPATGTGTNFDLQQHIADSSSSSNSNEQIINIGGSSHSHAHTHLVDNKSTILERENLALQKYIMLLAGLNKHNNNHENFT